MADNNIPIQVSLIDLDKAKKLIEYMFDVKVKYIVYEDGSYFKFVYQTENDNKQYFVDLSCLKQVQSVFVYQA